jgi:hypothetical protein
MREQVWICSQASQRSGNTSEGEQCGQVVEVDMSLHHTVLLILINVKDGRRQLG